MSIEINVFINDIHAIKRDQLEGYCNLKGIDTEVYPKFDIDRQTGFLPFRLQTGLIDKSLEDKQFLTGFELYIDPYDYEKEFKLNDNDYIYDRKVDSILKECPYVMTISMSAQDSFEPLIAYAFCGYIAQHCRGIIFDCGSGEIVEDTDKVISDIVEFLKEQYRKKELLTHPFEGWS